jgi:hypothetical protein
LRILRTDPIWHHTTFDTVEKVARSISSAVVKATSSRVDAACHTDRCILDRPHYGHWGIQFRHNLRRRAGDLISTLNTT